ncbi:MAG: GNAT family N-acetyltransferase, partial [Mangrovimonas sp.]|nr:GNAT family N-acetyltransferase [Mangrovimonas sp.]
MPLYVNAGSTLTKGVSYELFTEEPTDSLKNKALLIFDVPRYFKLEVGASKKLGLLKVRQYPGYLIQLNDFTDLNDYLSKTFSKSSNQKFKRYQQRLEQCFTIDYKVYHGAISKEAYEHVFNSFYRLLTKRFDDKQTVNNNLFDHEWNFYHDVVYQMILEKKASLYVIYSDQKPISVRLNYYSDEIIFDAITVFDIDYSKFHLGKISIMKVLE